MIAAGVLKSFLFQGGENIKGDENFKLYSVKNSSKGHPFKNDGVK